jgi:hypothetical protein
MAAPDVQRAPRGQNAPRLTDMGLVMLIPQYAAIEVDEREGRHSTENDISRKGRPGKGNEKIRRLNFMLDNERVSREVRLWYTPDPLAKRGQQTTKAKRAAHLWMKMDGVKNDFIKLHKYLTGGVDFFCLVRACPGTWTSPRLSKNAKAQCLLYQYLQVNQD